MTVDRRQPDRRWAEPGWWTVAALEPQARAHPEAMARLGLRGRHDAPAHALALAGTSGLLDADAVHRRILEHGGLPRTSRPQPAALAALALLWCGRNGSPDELETGAALYRWLVERDGVVSLRRSHQITFAQALLLTRRNSLLTELLPELDALSPRQEHYLRTDLAHPYARPPASRNASEAAEAIDPHTQEHKEWERLLSQEFLSSALAPVQVRAPAERPARHLFDQLTSAAGSRAPRTGGPLVTVVVPAYRPDEGLLTSLASLTAQTYSDLEIVVVDDGSGPDYQDLLDAAVRSDPRARLLRMSHNGGSYLARQAAIEDSRGELITTQDADDWSHPQRIAAQVAVLREHPEAPASRSRAVRAKDDLTHQWFGYEAVRDNASSLMVRRSVMERAGTFLPLRKAADSEYAERLATLVGPVVDTGSTLAITRLRSGSLSRGDFSYQWSDPDRILFRGTYRAWHRHLAAQATRDVSLRPGELPVPVADSLTRGLDLDSEPASGVLLCYLGDLSGDPTEPDAPWHQRYRELTLDAHADRPGRPGRPDSSERERHRGPVGLWHVETPQARRTQRPEMHPAWFDAVVAAPGLRPVTRLEAVVVERLVVLDAQAMLLSSQSCAVTARSVQVQVQPNDVKPGPAGLPVDLLGVSDVCLRLWGHRPRWLLPAAQPDRDVVRAALPGMAWHEADGHPADPAAAAQSAAASSTSGTSSSASRPASTEA